MGGTTFMVHGEGAEAAIVFDELVRQAQWEHGHGGYTGTIAEKDEFVMIPLPDILKNRAKTSFIKYAESLIAEEDERIDDKDGPAGCFKTDTGFLFFGWART